MEARAFILRKQIAPVFHCQSQHIRMLTTGDKNHVRVGRYWSVTWTVFAIQSSISGWFSLAYPDVTVTLSFCFCRGGGVNGSQSIYIKDACLSVCLSVCLFVCSDLEPKLLDGFQPNLAWTSPWTLWATSKYFFGLTPPGGV